MMVFKAFKKPFEAPLRNVKKTIFFSPSEIETVSVNSYIL